MFRPSFRLNIKSIIVIFTPIEQLNDRTIDQAITGSNASLNKHYFFVRQDGLSRIINIPITLHMVWLAALWRTDVFFICEIPPRLQLSQLNKPSPHGISKELGLVVYWAVSIALIYIKVWIQSTSFCERTSKGVVDALFLGECSVLNGNVTCSRWRQFCVIQATPVFLSAVRKSCVLILKIEYNLFPNRSFRRMRS